MSISRRHFMATSAVAIGSAALLPACSINPNDSNWPGQDAWDNLKQQVGGRLIEPKSPLTSCAADSSATACRQEMANLMNPFFIEDQAGATQSQGWLDAWDTAVSPYAVAAISAADVAAAVTFAHEQKVRLVVKGTGHDYLGRSNAPDSLLIWTHNMRDVQINQSFRIAGDAGDPVTVLTVAAGARWLEVYKAASEAGLYVQGGGCTSVGASGGFIQGSGFGSFSKMFGTGAGGVLEFEVVTANGEIVVANSVQNSDLFWALRGGGGGTFGVVTRTTLLAHPIPRTLGILSGTIKAKGSAEYTALVQQITKFIPSVNNPNWGEQIRFGTDNTVNLGLVFVNLDKTEAEAVWEPFLAWTTKTPGVSADLEFVVQPFKDQWNAAYWDSADPSFITHDPRPGTPNYQYWWTSNQGEVSAYWAAYQSRWLPQSQFDDPADLADQFLRASKHSPFTVQLNKGLAGEAPEARKRDEQTSLHPAAFDAVALIITAQNTQDVFPGIAGHEPDVAELSKSRDQVNAAIAVFRTAFPDAGSYSNEADYFETDWKNEFWGSNYERLLAIKKKVDPDNIFRVHHGVGSDA